MKRQLRSLLLSSTVLMGTLAFAQPLPPYQVVVQGTVLGCTPNSFVNVVTATNTQPEMDIDVPIGPSCTFYVMLTMETPTGAFVITTPCNGAIQTVTAEYVVNALDSNYVTVLINCAGIGPDCNGTVGGTAWPGTICDDGNPATVNDNWSADCLCTGDSIPNILDCLGILNGPNLPGTSCLDPMTGVSGTWGLDCICAGDTTSGECYSGFFVMQAYQWVDSAANPNGGGGEPIPNELWIWNLSSGGTGSLQYTWDFGDGTTSTDPFPTHTYASGSAYLLCLTIADGAGCTDTYCDSISVDGDGLLNGLLAPGNRNTFTVNVMNALSTGVQETPAHADLSTWPNPVSNNLMLSLQSAKSGRLEVSILDLNGRVVLSTSDPISAGKNQLVVPVNELVSGVYVVRIGDGTNSVSRRFVKQ